MKTKQDQINEMVLAVPQTIVAYDANPKGQRLYGEQRQQIAETLYEAGYRKTPNDIREMIDVLYEGATLKEKLDEIKQLKNENNELKAKLEARLTCDAVKGFAEREVKKARKETAKEIISAMKTMIINRRADERSGLNLIYATYSPERLFNDISEYIRITVGVEVEE